jgi:small subunit ribosomal protein S9
MATDWVWGTGRRKTSVARVRMRPGTGVIKINSHDLQEYFARERHRETVLAALKAASAEGRYDIIATVKGGGVTGQAGALSLGIARALVAADGSLEKPLREHKLLTRDPRMVERKKFGFHKARRAHQYSKR